MAAVGLTPTDFAPWGIVEQDKLVVLIEDVLAQAAIVAPCILEATFPYAAAAKALLREAVLRRLDAGSGAIITRLEGTGPFQRSETIDNRIRRGILQPLDISDLQKLCVAAGGGTSPRGGSVNLDPNPDGIPDAFSDRPDLWFQTNFPSP